MQGFRGGPIKGRAGSRRARQGRKPARFTGGDRGNGSGSIRLMWGKLLEEKGARRGWPVDLGHPRGAEQGHRTARGCGGRGAEGADAGKKGRWGMTGGVGLSARGVNAACGSVLGDVGERAARLRQWLRWAARVGQAQGERKRPRTGEKERMSAAWAVGLAQVRRGAGPAWSSAGPGWLVAGLGLG